ncbi:tumor protein D52 isoform X4 [Amblyraja radiata]|uniref:tumor protein D52 isoform X4 n=1 Tax=Amblyraja radiata TaxID=386614 RepID=UPI0014038558|nr:tumor protein D52 isoform X4 [Amblyraja radiata]
MWAGLAGGGGRGRAEGGWAGRRVIVAVSGGKESRSERTGRANLQVFFLSHTLSLRCQCCEETSEGWIPPTKFRVVMERDKEQAKVKIFNWKANFSELKRDLAQVDWKRRLAGLLQSDPVAEVGEDAAATADLGGGMTDEDREELTNELAKVEDEIQTLSQVLAAKEKHVAELKKKLGLTPLHELKNNLSKSWLDVQSSVAFKKTSETLAQASQKASSAFNNFGSAITKKFEDVRNSPTFKSFEDRVENIKSKVAGNKEGGGDFGNVLNSAANATASETITEEVSDVQEAH